ncbi:MAG: hypothetical protein HYU36_11145 [Planctomycetes bacterium]|nr:hypothetical protein [Planctomycetota bacterium]
MARHLLSPQQVTKGFTGMIGEPRHETEVVTLFGMLVKRLGFVVERAGPAYPDLTVWWHGPHGPERLFAEVEVDSAHFAQHRHDPQDCDLVIAWRDSGSCAVPVLALDRFFRPEGGTYLLDTKSVVADPASARWFEAVEQRERVEPEVTFLTPRDIAAGFSGLIWPPENEQEVSVLLGMLLPRLGLAIESYDDRFPDLAAWRTSGPGDPKPVRIELEYSAGRYAPHQAHKGVCDLVMLWEGGVVPGGPEIQSLKEAAANGPDGEILFSERQAVPRSVGDAIEQTSNPHARDLMSGLLNDLSRAGAELVLREKSVSVRFPFGCGQYTYFLFYPRPHANYVHPTIEFFEPKGLPEGVIAKFNEALAGLPVKGGTSQKRVEIRKGQFNEEHVRVLARVFQDLKNLGAAMEREPCGPSHERMETPGQQRGRGGLRRTAGIKDVLLKLERAGALVEENAKGISVRVERGDQKATLFIHYPGGSPNYPRSTLEWYTYQLEKIRCPDEVLQSFEQAMSSLTFKHGQGKRIPTESLEDSELDTLVDAVVKVVRWSRKET